MRGKTFGIYGLGLIGGSVALAIKKYLPDSKVYGIGRSIEKLRKARNIGMIDDYIDKHSEEIEELDYLIICTPAQYVAEVFEEFSHYLNNQVIVMDVSSVKRKVIQEIEKVNHRGLYFVGTHPLAGGEKSGLEFARHELFDRKIVAVVGEEKQEILEKVRDIWKSFGAQIVLVSADFHDEIVSSTSHIPHLVTSALCQFIEKDGWSEVRFFGLYGKGLTDTTRIAQGNPEMWTEILLSNSDNVSRSLKDFTHELDYVRKMLDEGNKAKLIKYLNKAKSFRETL